MEGQIAHQAELLVNQIFDQVIYILDWVQKPTDFAINKKQQAQKQKESKDALNPSKACVQVAQYL